MALPSTHHLDGSLIVSVQAPEGSPMRHPDVIAAMAEASLNNGAIGVRLESPEHIGAVRRRCPDALIIGLWKRTFADSPVYITPGWEEIRAVWAAGADVIALDATERRRPADQLLPELVQRVCRAVAEHAPAAKQEEAHAWEEERRVSRYAEELEQLSDRKSVV